MHGELDIVRTVRFFLDHKRFILLSAFALALVVGVFSAMQRDEYEAAGQVVNAAEQEVDGTFAKLMGGLAGSSASNDFLLMQILNSRDFLLPYIKESGLKKHLFPRRWDAETQTWRAGRLRGPLIAIGILDKPASFEPTDDVTYSEFRKRLNLELEPRSRAFSIEFRLGDPVLAAQVVNDLIVRLNRHMQEQKVAEARSRLAYLEQEVRKSEQTEVRTLVLQLMARELRSAMTASMKDEAAVRALQWATPPDESSGPKRLAMTAGGFLIGLILSCAFLAVRGWWRHKVLESDTI